METPGYIVVETSPGRDPNGAKLTGVLRAQTAIERWQARRDLAVHLLALASLPLGWVVWETAATSFRFRSFTLAGWVTALGALIIAGVLEWKYRRARASLMVELGSPPRRAR